MKRGFIGTIRVIDGCFLCLARAAFRLSGCVGIMRLGGWIRFLVFVFVDGYGDVGYVFFVAHSFDVRGASIVRWLVVAVQLRGGDLAVVAVRASARRACRSG